MSLQLKQLFVLCIALISVLCSTGQQLNYSYTNYTLENGLPSNECHKVVEDNQGYIWIATDRGLSRFDGYTFKNYGINEGLKDISCLNIVLAPSQEIWIYTASHRIFIFNPLTGLIRQFQYDHLLKSYKDLSSSFNLLDIDQENRAYFQAHNYGIVIVDNQGKIEFLNQHEPCFFIENINDHKIISYDIINAEGKISNPQSQAFSEQENCLQYKGMSLPLSVNNHWSGNHPLRVFDEFSGKFILASINGINFFINDHGLLGLNEVPHTIDIARLKNKHLLSAHLNKGGVRYYDSELGFRNNKFSYLLSDVSATSLLRDKQDNIWVSTLEDGIFYLKEKDVKMVANINFSFKKINHLEKDKQGNIYMIIDNTQLAKFDTRKNIYTLLHDYKYKIFDLTYNAKVEKLLVSAFASSTISLETGQPVNLYYEDQENLSINSLISSTACDLIDNNQFILSRRNGFSIIDQELKNQISEISKVTALGVVHRVTDFKENELLIASANGLFTYHRITQELDTIQEYFGQRFNDAIRHEEKYYLASQGKGVVIWDGNQQTFNLNEKSGLLSNNIEKLYIDHNKLYVCTYQGLSRIEISDTWEEDLSNIKITNFSKFQGLPSKDVYDVIDINGDLYIATGKGLAIMPKGLKEDPKHNPIIDKIRIGEKLFAPENSPREQSYNNNNLSIQYKSLDMKMLGNITYRHRLNNNPWVETKATQVDFSSLGHGSYSFNIQSKNINGKWSPSVVYDFIVKAPFWQKWWFIPLVFLGSLLLFFLIFNRYRGRVKLEEELRALEKSALLAQMNPHFIFNSLNSIQNFIMNNNKEQAMNYLAQFAKLIRQNLNASTESSISLEQEVSMLRNYLTLEKLRFKNIFDFAINIEPKLDLGKNFISPMLIQPFVENAVVHGMSSLNSDGLIEISFGQDDDNIYVTVSDNGKSGLAREKAKNNSKHKSKGVSITSRRLAHINKEDPKNYQIVPETTASGTKVKLRIAKFS